MLNRYTTRTIWRSCSPETEAVTLRVRGDGDQSAEYTDYALYHVEVGHARGDEQAAGGMVVAGLRSRRFSVWQDDLDAASAPAPKVGDLLTRSRDGSEWVIQAVENGLFENGFGCECRERA